MADFETKEIKAFDYERPSIEKGYANQTLHVNISDSDISIKPVTEKMKEGKKKADEKILVFFKLHP